MFSIIQEAIYPIIHKYNAEFDPKHKKFVERLKYKQFDKVIRLINKQKKIKKAQHIIYKQSYITLNMEPVSYVFTKIRNVYHTCFDVSDEYLILNALTPYYLYKYINKNRHINYIFLTLNYGCNAKIQHHQAGILIDNKNEKIYLIDPNGFPTYFNELFGIDMSYMIEKLLYEYFLELKKFGFNYEYIFTYQWNPNCICLNKIFPDNNYIGSGHCVILTILIFHLINVFNYNPIEIYEMLNKLSDEELLYIIKNYTTTIYKLFN